MEVFLEGKFDFKTITSPYQAEEMAEIILRRSRESLGLNITCGFKAYELHIGDICKYNFIIAWFLK